MLEVDLVVTLLVICEKHALVHQLQNLRESKMGRKLYQPSDALVKAESIAMALVTVRFDVVEWA